MNIMFLSLNILSKSRFNLFKFIYCVAYFEFAVYYYCYYLVVDQLQVMGTERCVLLPPVCIHDL